ncbi:MAG: hypothetical protein JSV89_08875 [Spirochaetaceae bacterium]|nr:MAG: hypothetical protein JSV89_08875 [Spirochaetaceae bacterium]
MAVSISRREIDKEADDNITLGRLLRIGREEPKKQAVERILASDLRIRQKIEKIREIDEKQEAQEIERIVQRAYLQAVRRQFVRIRDAIKAPQKSIPYFPYLLRERGRVREFGRKTHVLSAPLLPPGVRINRELRNFFVQHLQNWSAEISPRLNLIAEHGWLHLTPLQYNLVVLLKVLADKILAFDFVHLNYRDRNLIDKLKRIESLFLMLHYRAVYIDSIFDSILTVYKKQGHKEEEGREIRSLAVRILTKEVSLPSLYNCIVGLNMVKYRRFLSLDDLIQPQLGDSVSAREFNCSIEVRSRIDEYVRKSLDSIKKLHSQLYEVRRLNRYLNYDEQGGIDSSNLRSLYERTVQEEAGGYETDQGNVLLFAQRLFEAFYRTFLPLLNGKVQIGGIGREAIFSRSFYEIEMARLGTIIERLKKGPFHFRNFPLSQYLQVKEAKIGAIGTETELIQLIDEGIACLADLGKSLARVLGSSVENVEGSAAQPLEPLIFQGKPYSIPCAEQNIRDRSYLEGKTVSEALGDGVSLCFTMGMLFRDRFVYFVLGSARRYEAELQAQLRLLKNLIDPEHYQEILSRYQ